MEYSKIIHISLIILIPIFGFIFSTFLGKLKKISNQYQGFTQGNVEGTITEKLTKVISWILYPQLLAIFLYLFSYYVFSKEVSLSAWVLVPVFWVELLIWIIVLGRLKLVSVGLFSLQMITSVGLSIVFLKRIFIIGPKRIIPDDSDIVFQFWILVLIYLVLTSIKINEDKKSEESRNKSYYKNKAQKFNKKYSDQLKKQDKEIKDVVIAILIKENFERPKIFRIFEKRFGETTGIAQVKGKFSDNESVVECIKIIKKRKSTCDKSEYIPGAMSWYEQALYDYNYDVDYVNSVLEILYVVTELNLK